MHEWHGGILASGCDAVAGLCQKHLIQVVMYVITVLPSEVQGCRGATHTHVRMHTRGGWWEELQEDGLIVMAETE